MFSIYMVRGCDHWTIVDLLVAKNSGPTSKRGLGDGLVSEHKTNSLRLVLDTAMSMLRIVSLTDAEHSYQGPRTTDWP